MTCSRRIQFSTRMSKMLLFCLLFLLYSSRQVDCFSVSAPPPQQQMSKSAQRRAMNSIWHYTQHGRNQNPDQALKLLERLLQQEEEQSDDDSHILKQGVVWNVLRSCRRQPLSETSLDRLEHSIMLLQSNPRLYHVNMTKSVLSTLLSQDQQDRAQSILNQHSDTLLSQASSWDESHCQSAKNDIWFHLNKNINEKEGAEYALRLLETMLKHDASNTFVSKGMVFNVLRYCQEQDVSHVDDVLERLLSLLKKRNLLDAKMLNEVLRTMTKSTRGLSRAEAVVKNSSIPISTHHYCSVLHGHAQRGNAQKAEQLLQSMIYKGTAPPNTVAYNIVLHALSNCEKKEPKVVERAEALFKKMNQDSHTQPDIISYTNMLNLYSKHGMGEKAQDLLEQMIILADTNDKLQPSERHYRSVIDALAKSGNTAQAEALLNTMRDGNVVPNKFHYCGVLNGYARQGQPLQAERVLLEMKKKDNVTPNIVAYNCAMFAWTKSGEVDAPFRAKALLDSMVETSGVTPNVITYNCLLGACAGRAMAKEAERLLKQMHELYESGDLEYPPNTISYNYVLDSLARSGDRVWTVLRAETLINTMKELYKAGEADTKPNMITYRSLLKCYSNWNLPQDAEQLLHRMEKLHEKGDLEYGPDRVSYRLVIDALSKAEDEEARNRAKVLQKEVEERYGEKNWKDETVIDMGDQMDALLEYMRE